MLTSSILWRKKFIIHNSKFKIILPLKGDGGSMSQLLIYAIKSAIMLTLLFVPGIFLIFREKMFRFNRFTLLAILVLSLVLPLCNISSISMDTMPAVQTL